MILVLLLAVHLFWTEALQAILCVPDMVSCQAASMPVRWLCALTERVQAKVMPVCTGDWRVLARN